MKRRTILATAGITLSAPLVGCLQESDPRTENENQEYEECHLTEIQYEWLPRDIKDEVDTALEEGKYETDPLLFAEAVDVEESYLVVDDTPYDPEIETANSAQILELREVDVIRTPEPRLIRVRNTDDRKHEMQIELADDETIVDETIALDSGEEVELDATDRFGTYTLSARVLTDHSAEEQEYWYPIGDSSWHADVEVAENGVRISHAESDLEPCSWDVTVGN